MTVTYIKGNITRNVHPDATSTQALLEKAGFIRVTQQEAQAKGETAVSPPDRPFDFLPEAVSIALVEAGINTLEELAETDAETLLGIDGIGNATLEKILEATAELP